MRPTTSEAECQSAFPRKTRPLKHSITAWLFFLRVPKISIGQTIQERWGALTPVQVAPNKDYVSGLISSTSNPTQNLSFTAVGYGTGEKFPIPGQETGPANPSGSNTDKFLIRYIAEGLLNITRIIQSMMCFGSQ